MRELRVAIVGVGPKGLFALERLLSHAAAAVGPGVALQVDLYEPHAAPGAGPVYDPGQPDYLRMNFAADRIDLWSAGGVVPAEARRSFVAWRGAASSEPYPPRAEVGRYLADGLALLLRHAPPGVRVTMRACEVRAVDRCGPGWQVVAEDGSADGYDEILVAVGHGTASAWPAARHPPGPGWRADGPATAPARPAAEHPAATAWPAAEQATLPTRPAAEQTTLPTRPAAEQTTLPTRPAAEQTTLPTRPAGGRPPSTAWPAGPWAHAAPLVPAVFPVARWLSAERIPAGAVVAVRGFALTFLDAALALSEGRGGAFESDGHPYRLRYVPGADGAGALVPWSRTGRPMLAKPDPQLAASVTALGAIGEAGRELVAALPEQLSLRGDLLAILASAAGDGLLAANDRRVAGEARRRASATARAWLEAACDGRPPPADLPPAGEVERSLAIGAGLHAPDEQWALGHMWRSLYPALVARLGGSGLAERDWPAFRRLAAQLERVSFGPPPVNAAKLLALVDAGVVDLDHVAGGRLVTRGAVTSVRSAAGERAVDVVVDAVLAPPGARDGVVGRLLAGGHARIRAGRRGLDVAPDAGVIGPDGERVPGLSVIGRATEDAVIGNDTLSRTLHPHADRWASRVVRRAVAAIPAELTSAPVR